VTSQVVEIEVAAFDEDVVRLKIDASNVNPRTSHRPGIDLARGQRPRGVGRIEIDEFTRRDRSCASRAPRPAGTRRSGSRQPTCPPDPRRGRCRSHPRGARPTEVCAHSAYCPMRGPSSSSQIIKAST
jgi:hypothetical protein